MGGGDPWRIADICCHRYGWTVDDYIAAPHELVAQAIQAVGRDTKEHMTLAAYHAYINKLDASNKSMSEWLKQVGIEGKVRHQWTRKKLLAFQKRVRRSQGESI